MSKPRSKRYQKAAALIEAGKAYPLVDAIGTVKKFPAPKFNPTVTLSFRLGIDPRKSDQMVRGSVSLPHGSGGAGVGMPGRMPGGGGGKDRRRSSVFGAAGGSGGGMAPGLGLPREFGGGGSLS